MTSDQYCFWLQGFFEISGQNELTPQQVQIIKDHLTLVFNKVTPPYPTGEITPDSSIKFPNVITRSNISCSINPNNDPPIGFR